MVAKLIECNIIMSDQAKRLRQLLSEDRLSQVELSAKIGRSEGTISTYLNSDTDISDRFLRLLEDKLGWSARWIRTGIGNKRIIEVKLNRPEDSLSKYQVDVENTARLVALHDPDVYQLVPILRYSVWASWKENADQIDFHHLNDTYPVYMPDLDGPVTDRHMVFEVLGDSMEPTINERAKVLAEIIDDGNIEYINSGVYVIAYRNNLVIKRIIDNNLLVNGTLALISDNPRHGTSTVRRDDIRYMWRVTNIVGAKVR